MIVYKKGPLGWAVIKDGKPVGRIKRAHGIYLVSIDGFRPGVDPATRGTHTFPSLVSARAKVREILE